MLLDHALLPEALTSIEAARDSLQLEDDEQDSMLAMFINAVTVAIENYCVRGLKSTGSRVEYVSGTGTHCVNVPRWPVNTLTAGTYVTGDYSETYPLVLTQWRADDAGRVWLPNDTFRYGFQNITLTGDFGLTVGVHDRDLAVLETACHLWLRPVWQLFTNQIGASTSVGAGRAQATFEAVSLPPLVKLLIQPYVDAVS